MNAEQVVEKILSEAKSQAAEAIAAAQDKAGKDKEALSKELDAFGRQTEQAASQAASEKKDRMLAAARMQAAGALLAAKAEVLSQLYVRVKSRIDGLPDAAYQDLMRRLIMQAALGGPQEIIVGKQEQRINAAFIESVNRGLAGQSKGPLTLAGERAAISGGFILSKGKIRINASSDVLVGQLRSRTEMKMIETLFS